MDRVCAATLLIDIPLRMDYLNFMTPSTLVSITISLVCFRVLMSINDLIDSRKKICKET